MKQHIKQLLLTANLMNTDFNFEEFWKIAIKWLHKSNSEPKFITKNNGKDEFKVTVEMLKKGILDGFIRTQDELIAYEDAKEYVKYKSLIKDLETKGLFQIEKIQGKKRWLVLDTFKRGKTLTKYEAEVSLTCLAGILQSQFDIDLLQLIKDKTNS